MNCNFFVHLYCFGKCARLTNTFSISIVGSLDPPYEEPRWVDSDGFRRPLRAHSSVGQPVGCHQHHQSWLAHVQHHSHHDDGG
jgi:hypothetical protein